ncbi:hypothetical protein GmHk_04G009556 [Glycine max]|nr:hypothetical protein GmHk_04G009556 [Glycine max]
MGLALFATVTSSEEKVEDPSSGLFCISDCAKCPVICSPPSSNANNTTTSSNITFRSTFSTTILFVTTSSKITITTTSTTIKDCSTTTFQVLQHATFRFDTATTYGDLSAT